MYQITKRMEVAGSHKLNLNYPSKCQNLHGHNWIIDITCCSSTLNNMGMVIDFTRLKELIHDKLDHKNLNDVFDFNPTAENIAKWIYDELNQYFREIKASPPYTYCREVKVQESEGNIAIYRE